ncbi:hypothetical protein SAMN04489844_0032 [Nocardioides exalbidus]|uniref:Uncharacterized protein n=1 Tax=Nocardioides exalbidus TaxID=402596 RepID=A0A1H4I3V4_9ACTN|nr:DUF6297 family protein [Nocardioides exalbidus]SEB28585.1 hypothetical protein SAMN04489844_0032 [Nocardioides exalbidus]
MSTEVAPERAEVPSAREIRQEIRDWRRGRAELKWGEAISDAYVALFCVVMIGAMAGNVVLNLRQLADETCTGSCGEVRSAAPWLVALAVALLALGMSRLLGPVFSPPASNSWVLSSPVDRGGLLRPGWLRTTALTAVGAALLLVAPAVLSGFAWHEAVVYLVAGSATALACVGVAALSQVHEDPVSRWLTWLVTVVLWVVLGLSATHELERLPEVSPGVVLAVAVAMVVVAVLLAWRSAAAVGKVSRRVLGQTEHLSPSLSGALSSVDLGLMYDVLLARRWGRGAHVRSHTGGPLGWAALVHRDLRRALRTPQPYVLLAGLVLVPYAAAEADAGRAVVLATTFAGLLGGPALCVGLRVVVRTEGLARMMPFRRQRLLLAHLVVPGGALMLFALSTTPTLVDEVSGGGAVNLAIACGLSSIAATVRWITGKPPNYAAPMVSTPAGGAPTGIIFSVLRGFDVWAITALPLMFGQGGMLFSTIISIGVIAFLTSDGIQPPAQQPARKPTGK